NAVDQITPYVLQEQGDWFEDEITFVRGALRPGQNVIDIGANYGTYALSMARVVGPDGHVWAFEPAPDTARRLAESIAANGFRQITLERTALSNVRGAGRLSRNRQPELNALVPAGGPTDAVQVATLDDCLDKYDWHEVAFVKMDAEGEEGNILRGGARFFAERSPLVQYEVKAGPVLRLDLVRQFAALGYAPYRLVPGLGVLAPFDPAAPVDGYLLNLFGCKPNTAARLAARGLLVAPEVDTGPSRASLGHTAPEPVPQYRWRDALVGRPYATAHADRWEQGGGPAREVADALALYAASRDAARTARERLLALGACYERFRARCGSEPAPLRLASLARVAREFGARSVAVDALRRLDHLTASADRIEPSEPFLAPCARFDTIAPGAHFGNWLRAAALEELERLEAFSSFYSGAHTQRRVETARDLGFGCAEMDRRLRLLQAVRSTRPTAPGE
ncbi:MAG TPA: FkbM family methyltransferase, partial [Gemmata sp.]